jgi:hypothetical protein
MAAAVSAAAVSAATTVEAATACCAAVESAANFAASAEAATATVEAATVQAATACIKATSAPAGSKTTSAPAAVEPRAGTDEQAAREVARTVVSVRRAGVRVIPIVAVGANGGWTFISRADPYAHGNALRVSVRRQGQGGSKYCKNH